MPACTSSGARERGQESVRMLAGLVRGAACRPVKETCPIHKRSAKSTRTASAPPGRRKHHGTPVQRRRKYCNHEASWSTEVGTRSPGCAPVAERCAGAKRGALLHQRPTRRRGDPGRWRSRCSTCFPSGLSAGSDPNPIRPASRSRARRDREAHRPCMVERVWLWVPAA